MITVQSWLRIALVAIGLLWSCSSQKQADSANVTLEFWQFWTDPEVKPVLDSLLRTFEEQNPGIKVKVTDLTWANGHEKIVVAFGSNSAPDVLELGSDWVPEFAYQGVLYDMSLEVDSLKKFYRMWTPAIAGNSVYGFPWIVDTRVLFYNKDLLKKAGYPENWKPATWEDLLQAVQKIHDPKNKIYGFGANSAEKHRLYKKFLPFFWANDGVLLSPDGKECWINSSNGRQALDLYVSLTRNGLIDTQLRLDQAFVEGKVGFLISGGWLLKEIRKNRPELEFGVSLMPRPTSGTGLPASFAGAEFLVVNNQSKHILEAMRLVRSLTDLEPALALCKAIGTPSPANALAALDDYYKSDPNLSVFQEQLQTSYSSPAIPGWVYVEEEIEKAVEQAMYGKKTPRQALDDAKVRIDKLLAEYHKKSAKISQAKSGRLSPEEAEQIISRRASQVLLALKNRDMDRLSFYVHTQKGVRLSPYSYVHLNHDLVIEASELRNMLADKRVRNWGIYDGRDDSIRLSFSRYYEQFIYDVDFIKAPQVGYNTIIGRGNMSNNNFQSYPKSIIVEYHFPGFDEKYAGTDWRSLRLVFEEEKGTWYLAAIIHDQWTI